MATISSGGIGSGLPVESLVTQLMAVEKQPLNAIDSKEAAFQAKLTAFGTMKSALATLQTAARALSTPAQLAPLKSSVANPTVLNVTAGPGATAATYNIEVKSLADSQKLKTSVGYATPADVVGTGNITLDFGSYDGAGHFTADPARTTKTITIDAAHNTLSGIKDAINASNSGVTASIINDGTSNYLALSSTATGAKNAMRIVADPALAALDYSGADGISNMAQTVSAKDAQIVVDTVPISKASNTITDAIEGVTLNLTDTTAAGVTTKLTLSPDTAVVKTAVETFVKAYNDATKSMADLSAYDMATGKGAVLNGDSTVRTIQTQLRSLLSSPIPGAPAGSASLPDIGISAQKDGSIAIDSLKLGKALADPTKNFAALFATSNGQRGYGAQMDVTLGRILSPVGTLPSHTNSINSAVRDLEKQRTVINSRLADVEKRYRAQFSALDKAMASMTTTSNFLTQQLASLAKSTG